MARSRNRRIARASLSLGVALLTCGNALHSACAAPVVDLSWDACSPIVVTKTPSPGQTISTLYVSATGLSEAHRSYRVPLWFAAEMVCSGSTHTPDAWRFDAAGCQESGRTEWFTSMASKSCPPASPPFSGNTLFDLSQSPIDTETPTGAMRVVIYRSYSAQVPDPAKRYLLLGLRFDHTSSTAGPGTPGVSCGGLDTPICFSLWPGYDNLHGGGGSCMDPGTPRSSFFRASDDTAIPLWPGQSFATFNLFDGTPFGCFEATPARSATWGQIKGQYR